MLPQHKLREASKKPCTKDYSERKHIGPIVTDANAAATTRFSPRVKQPNQAPSQA
jgi:hypothetical protein